MPTERIIPDRPELVSIDEHDEETWRQYFAEFKENVWPIFKDHGFTPSQAYFAWELNRVLGSLNRIEEKLDEDRL